jgi:hypothetical protein
MDVRRARDGGKILPQPAARQNCQSRIELIRPVYLWGPGGEAPVDFFSVWIMADNPRRTGAAIEVHYQFFTGLMRWSRITRSHKFSAFLKMLFAAMHESASGLGCVKTCIGEIARNCFLCRGLITDVRSTAGFCISEIEMEILLSRTASEFSHSLGRPIGEESYGGPHGSAIGGHRTVGSPAPTPAQRQILTPTGH